MSINHNDLILMYRKMLKIRRFEERIIEEYGKGNIYGFVHSYIGQEAIAVGVCAHLRKEDRIVSNHRGHGHCIAKGADINKMMAEVFGKATGYCKGKGGSMHIADFEIGMLGANGIVGAGLPIGLGAGMSAQLDAGDNVAVVFFGDGSVGEGEFHETLNMASIWNLPIVFVCENNQYGVNTPTSYSMAAQNVADCAVAYSMPGETADGNDLFSVYETAQKAVNRARSGEGPSLLEFKTYRWRAHFEGGGVPDLRDEEEKAEWQRRCPLLYFERKLDEMGVLDDHKRQVVNAEIMAATQAAVQFSVDSPEPVPEDALTDIYSE